MAQETFLKTYEMTDGFESRYHLILDGTFWGVVRFEGAGPGGPVQIENQCFCKNTA